MAGRNQSKKPTIFDVASLAGVSIKTVSRVVNDEPNVQDKTRKKVLKAIEQLSYRPNTAARGLSAKRSFMIGLVYENPQEFSYVKDVLNGALEACEAEGYTLLLRPMTLPDKALADNIGQFVSQTNIDGIVLPAPIGDVPEVRALVQSLNKPCAFISPKQPEEDAIIVNSNDEAASFRVTQYVAGQGHTRIGFIKGHPDHAASENRLAGYKRALRECGIKYDRALVRQGYFDFESGQEATRKLLKLKAPPTAIIASNDDMAAGAMFVAHEMGMLIPHDISVVGFDDTPIARHIWPPLTTVRQPITLMSQTATGLLIQRLRGHKVESPEQPFDCEIVVRASTGSKRGT